MNTPSRIYVADYRCEFGSATELRLLVSGHSVNSQVVGTHAELDQTSQAEVTTFFVDKTLAKFVWLLRR
jgi:hypothetical protein